MKLKVWHVLLILMIIGFVLRVYDLGGQSLWIDEGYSINAANGILEHGYPVMESGRIYSSYILNTYLMSGTALIFGDNEFGFRFISVIFGVLMIPLMYFFGKDLGNKRIGWILALIVTFSFWEIAWSRQARGYMQLQFFYFLSLYFFYRFMKKRDGKNFLLGTLATLLAVLTHEFAFSLFGIFLIYILIAYMTSLKQLSKELWTKYTSFYKKHTVWFFILTFLIIIFFIFIIRKIIAYLTNWPSIETHYFGQYLAYLTDVHAVIFYLGIIGLVLAFKDYKKGLLLVLAYVVPFFFIVNYVFLIHFRYLFFIMPILFILVAYCFDYILEVCKKFKYPFITISVALVLFVLAIYSEGLVFVPGSEYYLEYSTPQPDFKRAYGFISDNMDEEDVIIASFPAMADIYTGKVDYWLEFSIAGRTIPDRNFSLRREIHGNAIIIDRVSFLKEITSSGSGWIVVDKLSERRIKPEMISFISENLTFYSDGSFQTNSWSGIKVFGWSN